MSYTYRQFYFLVCEYLLYTDSKHEALYKNAMDHIYQGVMSRYPERVLDPEELQKVYDLKIEYDIRKDIYSDLWKLIELVSDEEDV